MARQSLGVPLAVMMTLEGGGGKNSLADLIIGGRFAGRLGMPKPAPVTIWECLQ